jgi:Zn-dependent protease
MVGRIGINALLIVVWGAAMWALGPKRIIGFTHIPALMALATSDAMVAAAIGGKLRLESPLWGVNNSSEKNIAHM